MLKETGSDRVLPVVVGPFEASAIIIEMEGMHPPRPLTHDLLAEFFTLHGFTMTGLYICGVLEDSFAAGIRYRKGFRRYEQEIRPSDGIALALRLRAPIYATEEVLSSGIGNRFFLEHSDPESAEYLYLGTLQRMSAM
jgi:bifunctional DNase/RNase